jgi:hypothetical protein
LTVVASGKNIIYGWKELNTEKVQISFENKNIFEIAVFLSALSSQQLLLEGESD